MPSERRYSRKGRESGITRALGVVDRNLQTVNRQIFRGRRNLHTLGTKSETSSDRCAVWEQAEKVIGSEGLVMAILPDQYPQPACFRSCEVLGERRGKVFGLLFKHSLDDVSKVIKGGS